MPKNIILLMTDQHRYDYMGLSPDSKLATPNLDSICSSVYFTNCQTVNPICTPARTSLITGKYSHQIGTLAMAGDLALQHPTFMQALQKKGYHTSGIGKFHYLQTWPWDTPRGRGLHLVHMKETMKKYGFDYIWETSGKQLALKNYCDYMEYLEGKNLLDAYRDFVDASGVNSNSPALNTDPAIPWPFPEEDYVDIVTCDRIINRIKNRPQDQPFYIFGSFCSPHRPYDPPKSYMDMFDDRSPGNHDNDTSSDTPPKKTFIPSDQGQLTPDMIRTLNRQKQASKAMVKLVDDQVGRILETLESQGLMEDTVILFTADHGDMLGDHFRIQKSVPYKEASTVPLGIYHPDHSHGLTSNTPISLIDVTATILDIAGIDPLQALSKDWPAFNNIVPCISFMPIVDGSKESIRDYTFSECQGDWQMIQTQEWKYIRYLGYDSPGNPEESFFDLAKDPDEEVNLINDNNYRNPIEWCKARREFIMDTTPPAQTSWATITDTGGNV